MSRYTRYLEAEWLQEVLSVKQRGLTGQADGVHTSAHQGVEEPSLSGVRASIVAMKPLIRVEPRDAGQWMREGKNDARQTGGGGQAFHDSAREGYTSRKEPGRV
jgi:hypothetical protein